MLISSVNFVNKGRGEKFYRREKDTLKEKSEDLTYCKKHAEKISKSKKFVKPTKPTESSDTVSSAVSHNDLSSPRTSGYGSSASVTSCDTSISSTISPPDRVSVTTVDEYNLFIDPAFYFVTLCKQKQITKCSSFTRHVIHTHVHENGGKEHVVQLSLTCDPNFYLTTDKHKRIELKLFQEVIETSDEDERLFTIHESASGQSFIQPTNHKGYYLHHLDDKLSVKKLELHLRPPEEYIFHVHSHGNTCLQKHPKEETDFRRSAECRNIFSGSKLSDISSTVNIRKQNGYCQSCVHQGNTKCMYINQSDHSDKYTMDEYQYSLSSLNGDVIKLGLPSRTHTEIVKTREKSPMQKPSQSKRDSFYKVVSLAGSCFGFVRKTQN